MVEFEVYASHGDSDVIIVDTLEEAIKEAVRLSMEWIDVDISIEKVERTLINKHFRNGGEVA